MQMVNNKIIKNNLYICTGTNQVIISSKRKSVKVVWGEQSLHILLGILDTGAHHVLKESLENSHQTLSALTMQECKELPWQEESHSARM